MVKDLLMEGVERRSRQVQSYRDRCDNTKVDSSSGVAEIRRNYLEKLIEMERGDAGSTRVEEVEVSCLRRSEIEVNYCRELLKRR